MSSRPRVIFYLGKGGVGKTVIALATAVRSAELGHKTLIISTDIAHNLADFLDVPVGFKPTHIAENLWAQEISAIADIQASWGETKQEIAKNVHENHFSNFAADDVAVFPGLDEIGSLSNLTREIKAGEFGRIIVDTAATGSTIRLLSLPDSFRWYSSYLQQLTDNRIVKVAMPLAGMFIKKPAEIRAAFIEKEAEVAYLRDILRNADVSSFRVVTQPERVALLEAERIIGYLSLYDYAVDGVVMNRVLCAADAEAQTDMRRQHEAAYLAKWNREALPFTVWTAPDYAEEICGLTTLSALAEACFGTDDPGAVFAHGQAQEIVAVPGGGYNLSIPMPFMSADDVRLRQRGNDLFIVLGNIKREMVLPAILDRYVAARAFWADGVLTIAFRRGRTR